ncbi:molybdate transport system ATP-binding protein [Cribrihabitans marinus]|uniref:Molybdate transport system ATP-binding protein n=1 Tax=Cribrihabitans marinus TaxID=1227549 RepID=A0A1H7CZH6_9RHOB|nr:molybdenum ABC transporter ATP-binding protein [Cribrihabitans marinus]GGH37157.1 molybdenum import ATP-binding protein ModC [Cribrihabitans marinus]SEJ94951.1 molybdate transport system ATP-binding protein [Cribrihabitans marinus]
MSLEVALTHALPDLALDISFEVPRGVTVLFGRSGAGKTTVVNAVAGLLRPDRGRVALDGRVLFDTQAGIWVPPHRRRLGYIFQEARLFPHMTVRQNLAFGRWFAPRGPGAEDPAHVVDLLGIGHLLDRRPALLSGGEKQRVAIGRALLARPEMILADEPLAALDEARKGEILTYLERVRDEVAVPILYVTHSVAEVARLASSVVVLQEGRTIRQGPATEVLADPAVMPTGVRAVGALIEAEVVRQLPDGLTELVAGGLPLFVPRIAPAAGAQVRLRIAAHDVILSRARPEGLSALNILPGRVAAIRAGEGPGMMVTLDTDAGALLARITRRSAQALGLDVGAACHAVLKSVAIAPEDVGGRPLGGP